MGGNDRGHSMRANILNLGSVFWLMVRVAAQNVTRRRWRAILLGMAVMLGSGVGFASFMCGYALNASVATSLSRMGADLVVVPRQTLVHLTSSLLTVQPTDEILDAGVAAALARIPGIATMAPQRIVHTLVDGSEANLIAFDPAHDFSVLPWLKESLPTAAGRVSLLAGFRTALRPGNSLTICGKPALVTGRLAETGVGPFDESYFLSFDALATLPAGCKGLGPSENLRDRPSAYMLRLAPGARAEDVKFAIAQIDNIRIVEANPTLTSSRQGLSTLMLGIIVSNSLQLTALVILVSLVFSAIAQERMREIGILRAMGAASDQVMTIMLAEAAIITGLGGLAGLGFGTVLLLIFTRSLGFYFDVLGIAFAWPPATVLAASAVTALVLSAAIGLAGAFVPAWRVRRMDPYALIQSETR
jgi:putative ABC transport system permease protein